MAAKQMKFSPKLLLASDSLLSFPHQLIDAFFLFLMLFSRQ